jgi:hypothetical protein
MKPFLMIIALLLTSGCQLSLGTAAQSLPPQQATMPAIRIASASTQPPREMRPVPTATAADTATPSVEQYTCAQPAPRLSQHRVVANVDYAGRSVDVAQSVLYVNRTGDTLQTLVMAVEANLAPDVWHMGQVRVEGQDAPYDLDVNRLTIELPAPFPHGCALTLDLSFRLNLPRIGQGLMAYKGYLGYNERQMNLGHWLPTEAVYRSGDWIVNEPTSIGEQMVLEQADWDVTLNISGSSPGLLVAAPGEMTQNTPSQWQFRFPAAREFSVSLSDAFRLQRQMTAGGTVVELFHFPDAVRAVDGDLVDGAAHALEQAARSFELFERLFGPYPYKRLIVVQGDFPDGMEFSGLVFVSTNWFYSYKGGADNYLTLITVHEVSHQWWYAQVGNDAALMPWLDEALATYSEYLFYEREYPNLRQWWWSFRVGYYNPQGMVDSVVYEFGSPRDYINAVYLRGVQMLHNVREDIGDRAFFDLLARYAREGSGRIATSQLFWSLFTDDEYQQTADTRGQFFRDPDLR